MIKITITGTGIIGKTSTGISVWWIRKILPDPDPNFIPRIRIWTLLVGLTLKLNFGRA